MYDAFVVNVFAVLDYTFLNASSVINVTEGESVTLISGLDPVVSTGMSSDYVQIVTEDGSAVGKGR